MKLMKRGCLSSRLSVREHSCGRIPTSRLRLQNHLNNNVPQVGGDGGMGAGAGGRDRDRDRGRGAGGSTRAIPREPLREGRQLLFGFGEKQTQGCLILSLPRRSLRAAPPRSMARGVWPSWIRPPPCPCPDPGPAPAPIPPSPPTCGRLAKTFHVYNRFHKRSFVI